MIIACNTDIEKIGTVVQRPITYTSTHNDRDENFIEWLNETNERLFKNLIKQKFGHEYIYILYSHNKHTYYENATLLRQKIDKDFLLLKEEYEFGKSKFKINFDKKTVQDSYKYPTVKNSTDLMLSDYTELKTLDNYKDLINNNVKIYKIKNDYITKDFDTLHKLLRDIPSGIIWQYGRYDTTKHIDYSSVKRKLDSSIQSYVCHSVNYGNYKTHGLNFEKLDHESVKDLFNRYSLEYSKMYPKDITDDFLNLKFKNSDDVIEISYYNTTNDLQKLLKEISIWYIATNNIDIYDLDIDFVKCIFPDDVHIQDNYKWTHFTVKEKVSIKLDLGLFE